ncbi:Leucine--tRNA ligase [uncultured archaeon]|nr:Leucine--tRNA ligase [uncultured archaeon]
MEITDNTDIRTMHSKWQKEWEAAGVYRADAARGKKKKFITAAFPYPNSPQHIGHGRTYTVADAYARYWRMKGYNVLFPMAFHVTGTPIISMAKKLREKDEELLAIFDKIYGISREKAATLTDPTALVMYFSNEIEQGMKEIGYGIDWRRKFYTFDQHFNRFIEWQFHKLKELGYLKTGEHPVPWCPSDNNAVSAHDTKGDIDPEIEDVTAVKFAYEDGSIIASTYRPETLFGVTNLWVNPDADYVKAEYGKEVLYLAQEAAASLALQFRLEIIGKFKGKEMVGKAALSPLGKKIPILPASFVKPGEGTGAVMSVPAHAPYDYLALRDLGKVQEVGLVKIIEIKGYDIPAKDVVEKMGVKSQGDPLAEEATKEVYKKEVHEGRMKTGNPEYDGLPVSKAREKIKEALGKEGKAMDMRIIANSPVFCRCGARIVVNMVKNQWFIDYGDQEWKKLAKECLAGMGTLPERTREDYLYTIDWLREKACVRAQGLGTPFPFDKKQIIESLSDSTIYMAFYTVAHKLRDIPAGKLDEKFFDYVFLGKGDGSAEAKELRESFLYWYPVDSRHSGADLVRNHLTFFIFNHAAIFPRELWPRQIVANGFVLMDGKKMSKSLGNILPLRKAIAEYGADVVRISIIGGADLSVDTDFSRQVAQGVESRLRAMLELVPHAAKPAKEKIDFWLLSRLNRRISGMDAHFEKLDYRELVKDLVYDTSTDLAWYQKRAKEPRLKEFFAKWTLAIAPLAPHLAEEIWHATEGEGFAVNAQMVSSDDKLVNAAAEAHEELLAKVIEDIEKISQITGMKPKKAGVFIADAWKRDAYAIAREERNFEKAMKRCMENPGLRPKGAELVKFLKQIGKNIFALPGIMGAGDEMAALLDAKEFMEKQLGIAVEVAHESGSSHPKAKNAMPGKPAIVLE